MQTEYSFSNLGIAPRILKTIERLNFNEPYPIQHKTIPLALEHHDVIGIAQTGTGKTLAFAVPTVQHLSQNNKHALVLAPTRELALQVNESMAEIARPMGIKTVVLIGGSSMRKQIQKLARKPRIIIATPGRLIDLIQKRRVKLNKVGILIIDEADRMMDMGFQPQIAKILKSTPTERQTMLFSATIPPAVIRMTAAYMNNPVRVEVAPSGTAAEGISHELFIVRPEQKREILGSLLKQYRGSILVFCRTKIGTRQIARIVKRMGHHSAEIHSDLTQAGRREALEGFKLGLYRILVATDIAARGLDIQNIELVINYDLPDDSENYVHRIGRTGRAGNTGHAISLVTPDQRSNVKNIERIIDKTLPVSEHEDVESLKFNKPKVLFSSTRWSRRRRGRLKSKW